MATQALAPILLDVTKPQKVSYACELWRRDEQIKKNIATVSGRIQPHYALRTEPVAVVGFGPSLNDTWEHIKTFRYVISCSGSHKFLLERSVVPSWHLDVDPRKHKVTLLGEPHPDVEYLIASTCDPALLAHLDGFNVKLWHVFDTAEEGLRTLPPGEWALTGGCSVGLRALTMARFLGFTDLHVFGIDGSDGPSGKHAAAHPNQAKQRFETVYKGVTYVTTPGFLEAARGTFHELDQMSDVKATFYGDGLVQAMAKDYVPNHAKGQPEIAFVKPELISTEYRALNAQLHSDNIAYGVGGGKHVDKVKQLCETLKTTSVLDYGAGKGYLAKALPFPIWEYDPAFPEKSQSPRPADLVVCTDVLEHVEPDRLGEVLGDIRRCVKQIGYFVIHTGPAKKTLPDGRNTHLIQQGEAWWRQALGVYFNIAKVWPVGKELYVLVSPVKSQATRTVKADPDVPVGLSFANLTFRRDPYVIGSAQDVLPAARYAALAATFPSDIDQYKPFIGGDVKWSLSERNNPDAYHAFIKGSPLWTEVYDYFKSEVFIEKILRVLKAHKIALPVAADQLRTRFEFSILPADGGLLRPHTDIASKVVTLVIGMPTPSEPWDRFWGGGTDVFALKDPSQHFEDYAAPADALETVHTYQYHSNQCVVFVKSDNSWHGVGPVAGPAGQQRRTITVNLERVS